MRIPHSSADRRTGEVAMTPMIDVVFLLLIFFVCTASFQIAEQILPSSLLAAGAVDEGEVEPEPELERVVVKLESADGRLRWIVNEQPYSELTQVHGILVRLAQIDIGIPVILDVDGQIPLGDVIDLYDICRAAGFDQIQFAASVDL